ncbi:MAG: hypothetical protein FD123_2281 [Bacteroidetes bacterium]|nr:MAG: hypothetical protein FD123_2281 [Bacteroidota bacterium]
MLMFCGRFMVSQDISVHDIELTPEQKAILDEEERLQKSGSGKTYSLNEVKSFARSSRKKQA